MDKLKKRVTYWSRHINHVATVKAVYNSAKSLKYFSRNKYEPEIIDAFGEWNEYDKPNSELNFFKLNKSNFLLQLSSKGFIFSRIKYILIFLLCFIPLIKYLLRRKPDYFIIHLITSLPLFLNYFFKFKSKIILRISGKPKMNILRYFFWKITLKKIYKITFPTKETYQYFKDLNIVDNSKLSVLYDPVLDIRKTHQLLTEDSKKLEKFGDYFLCIGRLTKQKNFSFIIKCFKTICSKGNKSKLIIIGEGEEYNKLKLLINKNNLQDKVILAGYKKNVFKYLKKAKAFILSSLWEDPGFVLVEAIYSNTFVMSSDCPSGPKELIAENKGILFESNSENDFLEKFSNFEKLSQQDLKKIKINAKKNIKKFTLFNHCKHLAKYILN